MRDAVELSREEKVRLPISSGQDHNPQRSSMIEGVMCPERVLHFSFFSTAPTILKFQLEEGIYTSLSLSSSLSLILIRSKGTKNLVGLKQEACRARSQL